MTDRFMDHIVDVSKRIDPYGFLQENEAEKYVLYGIGNLAGAVVSQLSDRGAGFELALVDAGYKMPESFLGIPVQTFEAFTGKEENRQKYCLVIGYAAGYRKKEALLHQGFFKNVYTIARPFEHHKAFDRAFVETHEAEYQKLYEMLADDLSRENLCAFVNARITEDARYVVAVSKQDIAEFDNDVYQPSAHETYLDVGAYQGGSINRFVRTASIDCVDKIIGLEPEDINFEKLCANLSYIDEAKKRLVKIGCYSSRTQLHFNADEDKCCRLDDASGTIIDVDTIDNICAGDGPISTFYMGISVADLEILKGAEQTIISNRPKMLLDLGLTGEEVFSVPLYLHAIVPAYKIYFRFLSSMPSRLFFYAI